MFFFFLTIILGMLYIGSTKFHSTCFLYFCQWSNWMIGKVCQVQTIFSDLWCLSFPPRILFTNQPKIKTFDFQLSRILQYLRCSESLGHLTSMGKISFLDFEATVSSWKFQLWISKWIEVCALHAGAVQICRIGGEIQWLSLKCTPRKSTRIFIAEAKTQCSVSLSGKRPQAPPKPEQ